MPKGFVLVALREGRRKEPRPPDSEIPDGKLREIETLATQCKVGEGGVQTANARRITRLHGTEILSPFNVLLDIDATDLKKACECIAKKLHDNGHSHSEGYGG